MRSGDEQRQGLTTTDRMRKIEIAAAEVRTQDLGVHGPVVQHLATALKWAADALGVPQPGVEVANAGPALAVVGAVLVCNPSALENTLRVAGTGDDARVWFLVCLSVDLLVWRDWGDRRDHPRVDRADRSHVPVRRADVAAAQAWARLQLPEHHLLNYLNLHFSQQTPSWPDRQTRRRLMLDVHRAACDARELQKA